MSSSKLKDSEAYSFPNLVKNLYNQVLGDDLTPKPDVVFSIQADGSQIEAHQFVLSLRSTVFNEMFKCDADESDNEADANEENIGIEISSADKKAVQNMLRYMYCDELPEKHSEIAATYLLSDKYKVVGLCEKLLALCQSAISIEYALIIYDQVLAMQSRLPTDQFDWLSANLLDILRTHTFLAFQSESFKEIREETLMELLKVDFLYIREIELFEAAMRWLAAADSKTIADQRSTLRAIKQLIRFPLMTKRQLYYAIHLSRGLCTSIGEKLFTEQELAEFDKYYETGDLNELKTVAYDDEPRRDSMVVKIDYDSNEDAYRMFDPFVDEYPDHVGEYRKIYDSMDPRTFANFMKKKFGKDYNKECTRKSSRQPAQKPGKESIYLFQVSCSLDDEEDWTEGNLSFEFYQNGIRKHEVHYQKNFNCNGVGIFSFDPPLQITLHKYYRLVFRTIENVSYSLAFDIEQISKEDDTVEGGKVLDVVLVPDQNVSDNHINELLFYYKQ